MLAEQRRAAILARIAFEGGVRASDIAADLGVSEMTIRRDIQHMHGEGLVSRVHGGARSTGATTVEPPFLSKVTRKLPEKSAIAKAAIAHVDWRSSIGITGGSTTYAFARQLPPLESVSVVTNSLPVAQVLSTANPDSIEQITIVGGTLTATQAMVGTVVSPIPVPNPFEWLFVGAHSVNLTHGLTSPNTAEALTNSAFMAQANHVALLADSSKFLEEVGISAFASLADVDVLFTDSGVSAGMLERLRDVVTVVIAPDETARTT